MSHNSERGRIAKDVTLSHEKQVKLAHDLKEKGYSNAAIAHIMRIHESTVRILLTPRIEPEQIIWYPGIYEDRTEKPWTKTVADSSLPEIIELVQKRAQEDGEWSIKNGHVGDNEDKMRRWMAFVSKERNIKQCVEHIRTEEQEEHRTIDWVCRELAEASMVVIK